MNIPLTQPSISHAREIEPIGRGYGTAGLAVAGFEEGLDVRRRPTPDADLTEASGHGADLSMQERAGFEDQMHLLALTPNPRHIERLERGSGLALHVTEGGEIVMAH